MAEQRNGASEKPLSVVLAVVLFGLTVVSTTYAVGVGEKVSSWEKANIARDERITKVEDKTNEQAIDISVINTDMKYIKSSLDRIESLLEKHTGAR